MNKAFRLFIVFLLIVTVVPLMAERGDDTNRKSKNGMAEGTWDGVEVKVEYGRPQVRGRAIYGDLIAFDKIWRTGADEATVITFSKDVMIAGNKVPAGSYSLFTIPTKGPWTVILNKVAKQWGAYKYDQAQDVLRFKVKPSKIDPIEELTFEVNGGRVKFSWETIGFAFTVKAAM